MLEPRYESKGTILLNELEETQELLFVHQGEVGIGFELNRKVTYVMKKTDQAIIGMYGLLFNQRAEFIFTAMTNISGYGIRKENWN